MFAPIDVETFLRNLGIMAKFNRSSHKWVASCPNPDHAVKSGDENWDSWIFNKDHAGTWGILDKPGDRNHGSHHCFACKWGGGPWELGAVVWGCSVEEAGKRVAEFCKPTSLEVPKVVVRRPTEKKVFELPFGSVIPGPGGYWFQPALDYLLGRGIDQAQIDKWGIGYAVLGRLTNRVIFPVYTEGELRTYSARAIIKSLKRYDAGHEKLGARPKKALFGEPFVDYGREICTVAEGCPSTLALERAGAPNPLGMLGSYLTPDRARILSRFKKIFIATDPDTAGDLVAQAINILSRRAEVVRIPLKLAPDDTPIPELRSLVQKSLDSQ
jgi:hypothetical protein